MNAWTVAARTWPITLPTVALSAGLQTAIVAIPSDPSFSPLFVAMAVASALFLVAAAVICVTAVASAVTQPGRLSRFRAPRATTWITASAILVAAAAASIVGVVFGPIVLCVGFVLLTGAALHPERPWAGFRAFRRHPVRAVLLALVTVLAVGVLWVGMLLAGLFLAPVVAAALSALAAGVVSVLLLSGWAVLQERPRKQEHSRKVDVLQRSV